MMGRVPGVATAFLLSGLSVAPAMDSASGPPPGEAQLAGAGAYSRSVGGTAFLVLYRGQIIHESYSESGSAMRPVPVMSITKSLAAVATLAAQSEGLLRIDEKVSQTIGEWKEDPIRGNITIQQLLDQTSGLAPGIQLYGKGVTNKNRLALKVRSVAPPGAIFDYGPANFEILEELLRRKLGGSPGAPLSFLRSRVLLPLGAGSPTWRTDASGNAFFSTGAVLGARDLGRFGEFVRTRGRIWLMPRIPAKLFAEIGTGSRANPMYGSTFWLNVNSRSARAKPVSIEGTLGFPFSPAQWATFCISPGAPSDLVAMVGSGGQRVYVVPSRKLVVVRLGTGKAFNDDDFLRHLFTAS